MSKNMIKHQQYCTISIIEQETANALRWLFKTIRELERIL